MAWIDPRTWIPGEKVTAAIGNIHWRDNLNFLFKSTTSLGLSSTGNINDWAPGLSGHTFINWSTVAIAAAITGIAGGNLGQRVTIVNTGTGVMTFAHNSSSSLAGNRFYNKANSAPTAIAEGGHASFYYNGTFWILHDHEQGQWIAATFNAAHYTGNGGAWTVQVGDINTVKYKLTGRTLNVTIDINGASTSGGSSTLFSVSNAAWGSYQARDQHVGSALLVDNGGTPEIGIMYVATLGTVINFRKANAGGWNAAATNNMTTEGTFAFEVY